MSCAKAAQDTNPGCRQRWGCSGGHAAAAVRRAAAQGAHGPAEYLLVPSPPDSLHLRPGGKGTRRATWRRALAPVMRAGEEESGKQMAGVVEDTTEPTTGRRGSEV